MSTVVEALLWILLLGAVVSLAWVYGSSWRAVARALVEAEVLAGVQVSGSEVGRISAVPDARRHVAVDGGR